MRTFLPCCLILIFTFGCKEDQETMSGEITGIVSLYSQQNIKLSDCSGVKVDLYQNNVHLGDTLTDTYGEFHFKNLPYGRYWVDLQKDDFIKEDIPTDFNHVGGTGTTVVNFRMFEIPTYEITIDSFEIRQGGFAFYVYLKVNNDTILPFIHSIPYVNTTVKGFSGSTADIDPNNYLGYAEGYLTDFKYFPDNEKTRVYALLYTWNSDLQPPGYDSVYFKLYPVAFGQGYTEKGIDNKALGKPSNVVVFHW